MKTMIHTLLLGLLLFTAKLPAAVTLNSSAALATNTASASFNNTGSSNTMLVVGVFTSGAVKGQISTVTYSGAFMTQAVGQDGTGRTMYLFYLSGADTGSHTLAVNFLTTPTNFRVVIASYDGVLGIGGIDGDAPANNTPMTIGSGTTAPNWAVYMAGATGVSQAVTNTALTVRQSLTYTAGTYMFGDTTITAALQFTGSGTYALIGTMLELQTTAYTATSTVTPTHTPTRTRTPTSTSTVTQTDTSTITPTNTPTSTITLTLTQSMTRTISVTSTITPTITLTATPTNTATPTVTKTSTASYTLTTTLTPGVIQWDPIAVKVGQQRLLVCTDWALPSTTAWTYIDPGCTKQPCTVDLAVPAAAAYTFSYWRQIPATTPVVLGVQLVPGQSELGLPLRAGEKVWYKLSAAGISPSAQSCK